MRFPDVVTIVRARGKDAYGNPGSSFEDPETFDVSGFEIRRGETLLLPSDCGIEEGDRVRIRGLTFGTDATEVRSPSRTVLYTVALKEVEGL